MRKKIKNQQKCGSLSTNLVLAIICDIWDDNAREKKFHSFSLYVFVFLIVVSWAVSMYKNRAFKMIVEHINKHLFPFILQFTILNLKPSLKLSNCKYLWLGFIYCWYTWLAAVSDLENKKHCKILVINLICIINTINESALSIFCCITTTLNSFSSKLSNDLMILVKKNITNIKYCAISNVRSG